MARTLIANFKEQPFKKFLEEKIGRPLLRWNESVTQHARFLHDSGELDMNDKKNYQTALDAFNKGVSASQVRFNRASSHFANQVRTNSDLSDIRYSGSFDI